MTYAALAAVATLLASHAVAVGLGYRLGAAALEVERHWRSVAESAAKRAAELAAQGQPDHAIRALRAVGSGDLGVLLDHVFATPDPAGGSTELDAAGGPVALAPQGEPGDHAG